MLRGSSCALIAVLAVLAVVATVAAGCAKRGVQPDACKAAVQCYFGDDANHQLGRVLAGLGNPTTDHSKVDIFVQAYGKDGSCWADREDTELMHSCEDRCRALLWTDCSQSYHAPAPGPFCSDTALADAGGGATGGTVLPCQFPMECRREALDGGATACPDPLDSCTAPRPATGKPDIFGCCDIGIGFPEDGGCAYENVDDNDSRKPAGNPTGAMGGAP